MKNNHKKISEKTTLFVSFSGGETSGYMCYLLQRHYADQYNIHYLFANTGQENEATLEFVQQCDEAFGLNVTWLEANVDPRRGGGVRFTVVDFDTASRNGEPFEAVIAKEGIPNRTSPHCSSRLKTMPIKWYVRSLGVKQPTMAIGIRTDEMHRCAKNAKEKGLTYPLIETFQKDKVDVNVFWEEQPFRLALPNHEGNCKTCWKKSDNKLFLIAKQHPERFDFFKRMEVEYGTVNPKRTRFFRGNRSVDNMLEQAQSVPERYLSRLIGITHTASDDSDGCSESCEPFAEQLAMAI
jgi:hypothetical protein